MPMFHDKALKVAHGRMPTRVSARGNTANANANCHGWPAHRESGGGGEGRRLDRESRGIRAAGCARRPDNSLVAVLGSAPEDQERLLLGLVGRTRGVAHHPLHACGPTLRTSGALSRCLMVADNVGALLQSLQKGTKLTEVGRSFFELRVGRRQGCMCQ